MREEYGDDALSRQVHSLRRQVQRHDEWIDTMSSSLLKRLWWALSGYRFRRVGRWYGPGSLETPWPPRNKDLS